MATKRTMDMIQFTQQYNANVIHELEMKLAAAGAANDRLIWGWLLPNLYVS